MAISAFKGPIVSFGVEPQSDGNDLRGPDVNGAGTVLQDSRLYTSYAGGDWVAGWFQSGRGFLTIDASPATANATCIAAVQSAATAVVLASANNSSSQVVVGATAINVNSGAMVTGLVMVGCPNATATGQFLAYGPGGSNGTRGVNVWNPANMVSRCITVTTAGTDTGRSVTIAGNDVYGVPMTQVITTANTSAVSTTKAFKSIRSITLDALPTGGISVGQGTLYGLPIRADNLAYVTAFNLTSSAVAITAAVTSAASGTSGDVRGTFACSASNSGLTVFQAVSASNMNLITTGTNSGVVGVDQA